MSANSSPSTQMQNWCQTIKNTVIKYGMSTYCIIHMIQIKATLIEKSNTPADLSAHIAADLH